MRERKRNSVKGDAMSSMKRVKYVRRKKIERALDPQKKRREVSTGSADKMQNVGRIREVSSVTKSPLPARALPFGFSEFTCDDAFFSYLQQLIMVNTLCPSVHLHLSFTCWLVSSSGSYVF